jgi:hypothetical protein
MKLSTSFGFAFSLAALLLSGSALPGALTPEQIQQSARGVQSDVIVILRDQLPNVPARRGAGESRRAAIAQAQGPILSELRQAGVTKMHSFGAHQRRSGDGFGCRGRASGGSSPRAGGGPGSADQATHTLR